MQISDYIIAKLLIESACKLKGVSFVDLHINFCEKSGLIDGKLCINNFNTWNDIVFEIVKNYYRSFNEICECNLYVDEKEEVSVLLVLQDFLEKLTKDSNILDEARSDESVVFRMYQLPFLWILFKDIVCPAFSVRPKNIRILDVKSPYCDISGYVKDEEEFVYVNKAIEYKPLRDASLFLSLLEAHGLSNIFAKEIMQSVLCEKLKSLLVLAYKEEKERNDFILFLKSLSGAENEIENLAVSFKKASVDKISQQFPDTSSLFWYFGLIEKMLEPSRGSDWSTYQGLLPWFKEIDDKIKKAKEEAGPDGLTYEILLRIKDGENKKEDNKVIEKRLGSDRVW